MKKFFVLVSCVAMLLILSKMNFAQEAAQVPAVNQSQELVVGEIVTAETDVPAQPHVLPFGYPPYPTVGGNPAYGVPYSYPRAQRRLGGRLFPRMQHQSYPLPTPGAVAGAVPPVANPAPPMYRGAVPPLQGTIGVPAPQGAPSAPNVFYRPTPIKNFFSLMTAPRPYIGYDPYAGPVGGMAPAYQPK